MTAKGEGEAEAEGEGTVVHPPRNKKLVENKKPRTRVQELIYNFDRQDEKQNKDDKQKIEAPDEEEYMDEVGTSKSKHKYGLQDELTAIYRKDCTIRIPFLSVSCLEPKVLLSSNQEDNDLRGILTNLTGRKKKE